jgi:hypothetical protein
MAEKKRSKKNLQIDDEIENHGKTWCSSDCQTFLPDAYREARLDGETAKQVQGDYDSCHVWR